MTGSSLSVSARKRKAPTRTPSKKSTVVKGKGQNKAPPSKRSRGNSSDAAIETEKKKVDPKALRSTINNLIEESKQGMSAKQKKDMAAALVSLCVASASAEVPADAVHTLNQALTQLIAGGRAPSTKALESRIDALEQVNEKMKKDKELIEEEKKELKNENDEYKELVEEMNKVINEDRHECGSSSHSSGFPMPSIANATVPARGTVVGHSTRTGRADEIIQDVRNIEGMDGALASVAVTSVRTGGLDESGEAQHRTVRTKVERIAVPEGTDVEQLIRMGFEIVDED